MVIKPMNEISTEMDVAVEKDSKKTSSNVSKTDSPTIVKAILVLGYMVSDFIRSLWNGKHDLREIAEMEEIKDQIKNTNFPPVQPEIVQETDIAEEYFFLSRMLNDEFKGLTEDNFKGADRTIFKKFNKLSKKKQLEKYKELENKLVNFSL